MPTNRNDFGLIRHRGDRPWFQPEFMPVTGCNSDCGGPNCTTAACNRCGCGCTHCPPPTIDDIELCDCLQIYALLAQNGEIDINADSPIPFSSVATASDFMERSGGVVRVLIGGIYLITYSVTIPCGQCINTRFVLRRNGTAVNGTVLHVTNHCLLRDGESETDRGRWNRGNESLNYFTQTIVNLSARDRISVTSSEAIDVDAAESGDTLATLSLVRLT